HPSDFLEELKGYQLSRYVLYNRLYWIYMVALCLGIGLYFFEILAYFSFWKQMLALGLTFGWLVFCSTIVRKIVIKKEKERIALLIEKFERISSQFGEGRQLFFVEFVDREAISSQAVLQRFHFSHFVNRIWIYHRIRAKQ